MISEVMMLLSLLVSNSGTISTHDYALTSNEALSTSSFTEITGDKKAHKVLDCPDGYVMEQVTVFKHSYTANSDLYLYKVSSEFVPGIYARAQGSKQADGNGYNETYLGTGFMHVAVYQYQGQEYGGEISYKDMSPTSTKASTTITSTYSKSGTIGFETGTGVSVDDSGTITAKASSSGKAELTYTHSKSVSTTSDDPAIGATFDKNQSTTKTEAQWSYITSNPEGIGGTLSFWLTTYLLFEMSNNLSYFNRDVFQPYIHYSFTCKCFKKVLWFKNLENCTTYTSASGGNYFM